MANKVFLTDINADIRLKNKGLTLAVRTDDAHRGYIEITKAYVRWYQGKEKSPRKELHMEAFIQMMGGE